MNHLSLFSGIGGIDLAAEWAGMKTVAFCEREPFPQKVLKKHWPDVPIYDDVKTLTRARLIEDGIIGDGRTIDIISAGYPCQPFSNAGERKGQDDDRHLWPEVKRLLEEIGPRWFVGENVAGHVTLGLDDVLSDLGNIGYTAQPVVIPAAAVGASHRRDRVFILANPNGQHVERSESKQVQREFEVQGKLHARSASKWAERSALYQPKLSGSFNGVPDGVDRIKSLGNAVVPQQIYPIMQSIKAINDFLKGDSA